MCTSALNTKRVQVLRGLGVEIHPKTEWVGVPGVDRREIELPNTVDRVWLPFTAGDWMDILVRGGSDYCGGSYGSDDLQELLEEALREGGVVSANKLLEMGELLREFQGHGDEPMELSDAAFDELVDQWNERLLGPIKRLEIIFIVLEPVLKPLARMRPVPVGTEADSLIRQLSFVLGSHSFDDLFTVSDDDMPQHEAKLLAYKVGILVLGRRMVAELEKSGLVFTGEAIVAYGTHEIRTGMSGVCLYSTVGKANRVLELTSRSDPELVEELEVVPVRISVEHGVEFL
jgi:hypothetical protein